MWHRHNFSAVKLIIKDKHCGFYVRNLFLLQLVSRNARYIYEVFALAMQVCNVSHCHLLVVMSRKHLPFWCKILTQCLLWDPFFSPCLTMLFLLLTGHFHVVIFMCWCHTVLITVTIMSYLSNEEGVYLNFIWALFFLLYKLYINKLNAVLKIITVQL